MEPFTQRILGVTLVTIIKGVAIAGLLADVALYYAHKNAEKIGSIVRRKLSH